MPVFDFSSQPDIKNKAECTYTVFRSNAHEASPEQPMMVLSNREKEWKHHSVGVFTNPIKRTSFEFDEKDGTISADILRIDARFVRLRGSLPAAPRKMMWRMTTRRRPVTE